MPEKPIRKIILLNILLIVLSIRPVQAQQPLSNLEVLYRLTDSAVVKIIKNLPLESKEIYLKSSLVINYSVFENRIINTIKQHNKVVSLKNDSPMTTVSLTIDRARVSYPEIFKDGFFGSFMVKREITLHGSYIVSESGLVKSAEDFNFANIDTVMRDEIKDLEDFAFPFTRAEVPPEPFFSSVLEPVVALGTAAAVIFLFFTVRSK